MSIYGKQQRVTQRLRLATHLAIRHGRDQKQYQRQLDELILTMTPQELAEFRVALKLGAIEKAK
jgi:hypothetical protein